MKQTKKLVSLCLALIMLFSSVPLSGNMASSDFFNLEASAAEVASGTVGTDNLSWKLDDDGTLTVSGTGKIPGSYYMDIPWYSIRAQIKEIEISRGVTQIGTYAFYELTNLKSVIIPLTVTTISSNAFMRSNTAETVYYAGTAEQWSALNVSSSGNEALLNANIVYNANDELLTQSSLMNLDSIQPAGFTTTTNPYGYDVGVPFLLSEQNEIMLFQTYDRNNESKKKESLAYFDGTSTTKLEEFVNSTKNLEEGKFYSAPGEDNMVQAIAFDPTGSGRQDHIAFVSVNYVGEVYSWVVTADETNYQKARVYIGSMDWYDDTYDYYQANNFLSIAAGDFDGDGKETVVVYAAMTAHQDATDRDDHGCKLVELEYFSEYNECEYKIKSVDDGLLNGKYIARQYSEFYDSVKTDGSEKHTDNSCRNKLCADLAVGDFNADGCDDLAVHSYANRFEYDDVVPGLYAQPVKIAYGGSSVESIIEQPAAFNFDLRNTPDGSENTYFPIASSIASGDIDGDGDDDLVVSGLDGSYKIENSLVKGKISVNTSKMRLAVLLGAGDNSMIFAHNASTNTNEWTASGYKDDDNCWAPFAVETVAINGKGNAEKLFVNGEIFEFVDGVPNKVYTLDYFNSKDKGIDSELVSHTFITSAVAGNFDGNEAGREQIVFVVGLRHFGSDDYSFKMGYIGGDKYDDVKDTDGKIKSFGMAESHTGTNFSNNSYIFEGKGDNRDEQLNCIIVSCDRDTDGVMARYSKVEYAYSDPEVKAVLQAAPYFSELSDSGNNETEYTLTTVYELTQSSSNNVSYSIGLTAETDVEIVAASIEAGYSMDWSQTFEETLTEEYSASFSATAYDTVVVNRVPVFIYVFDVQNADGTWPETDEEKALNEMVITIPQEPIYESLSVDNYNDFAEAYNAKMSRDVKLGAWNELHEINAEENWMHNNEGNPYAYNQNGWSNVEINAKQISKAPVALGTNNSLNKVSWTEGNSNTESTETSHGFYFSFSALVGPDYARVGYSTNLSYSHGKGTATTNGSAIGTACTVTDIDGPGLLADGVSQSVIDSYKFNWTFGQWERHLCGYDGQQTIFVGYALENLTSPALTVDNLKASATGKDSIKLTWSEADTYEYWPESTGYYVYKVDEDGYTKVSARLDKGTTDYTVTGLDSNTEYDFVVTALSTVDKTDYESIWSNEAKATTYKGYFGVDISATHSSAVDLSVTHMGNIEINSGDKVVEDNAITVSAKLADERYSLEYVEISSGGDVKKVYPDSTGTLIEYMFFIEGDTTINVHTKYKASKSRISYSNGDHGTVTATVDGVKLAASGGTVNGNVVFSAEAERGYVLKEWKITDADGTVTTLDAIGRNPFTLIPTSTSYTVEPVYVKLSEVDYATVRVVLDGSHAGTVEIYDSTGKYLGTDSANVAIGSVLTFKAVPIDGCKFVGWRKGADGNVSDTVDILITGSFDITAEFYAPITYTISYSDAGESPRNNATAAFYGEVDKAYGNELVSSAEFPANATVNVSVASRSNMVIKEWNVIDSAGNITVVETKTAYPSNETLAVALSEDTEVQAVWMNKADIPETPTDPEEGSTQPEESSTQPEESSTQPEESSTQPEESSTQPEESTTQPEESTTQPEESTTQPEESTTQPEESTTQPEESTTQPEEDTAPENPDDGDGEDDEIVDCDHLCHSDNKLVNFFWKIIRFLQKIFGIEQYCECGRAHW